MIRLQPNKKSNSLPGNLIKGFHEMHVLIWGGAAISLVGLIGLLVCIHRVAKAKKAIQSEEELRYAVRQVLPMNLGSLLVSALGLMAVVVGILLSP